jgi:hypothetical protein
MLFQVSHLQFCRESKVMSNRKQYRMCPFIFNMPSIGMFMVYRCLKQWNCSVCW